MAIVDYTSLIQALSATAEDDSNEFMSFIPIAIDLAEETLFRELELPDIEIKAPGVFVPGTVAQAKPTGYRYCNYFKFKDAQGKNVFLKKRRDDFLQDYWPDPTLTDVPKYYSDASVLTFDLAPTPDVAYVYEIKYTRQPLKLTATNATNYFTDRCQDILFLRCMLEMSTFMKAWTQVPIWQAGYDALKASWNLSMARVARDDGHTPENLSNAPNTIKGSVNSAS